MTRALVFLVGLAFPGLALAQVSSPPASDSEVESAPTADVQAAYDRAFGSLLAGDWAAAIEGFDRVARLGSGAIADRAEELGRLARAFQSRNARLMLVASPGQMPPDPATAAAAEDGRNGGRVAVVASTTAAGFYAGATFAALADADFQLGTLLVVSATGGSFLASLHATRDRNISEGTADAYSTGLLLGLGNGLLLASPLGLEHGDQILGLGLAGMSAGGIAGMVTASRTHPTSGQSSLVSTLSTLGFATTGLGMLVVHNNLEGDDALLLLAAGMDAGAIAGLTLSPDLDWSKGRGRWIWLGTVLGGVAGLGGGALAIGEPNGDDDERILAASVLAGLWTGFGLSIYWTRDMPPDARFASSRLDLAVLPMRIRNGHGLAITGSF